MQFPWSVDLRVWALGTSILAAIFVFTPNSSFAEDGTVVPSSQSTTSTVARILPGVAKPKQNIDVYPPFAGTVGELLVHEGDVVEVGQRLFALDDRVAAAAVRAAEVAAQQESRIAFATADLEFTRRYFERISGVDGLRAVSQHEIDEAAANLDKATANLRLANHEQDLAIEKLGVEQARLDTHTVRAPFDGQIIRVNCESGQKVHDNEVVLRIQNRAVLTVELYLPIPLYQLLENGMTYSLKADEPVNRTIMGKVVSLEPVVDPGTQTFRCVFEIENSTADLPSGFIVRFAGGQEMNSQDRDPLVGPAPFESLGVR